MVKRPTDSDSDGESLYANGAANAHSPKRARTADSDNESSDGDDMEDLDVRTLGKGKGKGEADAKANGKGKKRKSEGGEDEAIVDEEDDEFEEAHREKILAELENKRKVHGGIADHGIIERIEMVNFMCHKYLKFEFGPQINFIIGHNGSGKSAVLSAITVALGGKSNSTGRGTGLKSFIKEGCSAAEVTIFLKNQGEEAYKPNEYGKSISITRRFTKEGNSTWKIKGERSQQAISSKKEELSAICDHMNIQVDNPMNVLTQDAARQFLSASHATDKYKFFLCGTQLSQLSEEYDTCLANIKQTHRVLAQKKEAIPELRAAFRDATVRFEEAAKAREQKQKADELKKELAWAHVRGKEEEMEAKIQEVAKLEARLPRIQKGIDEAQAGFDKATDEVTRHEAEAHSVGDLDELNVEKNRLQALIKTNKNAVADYMADMKKMEISVNALDSSIQEFNGKIEEETQRMAANTQAKHDETQRKLEEARNALHEHQTTLETLSPQMQEQDERNKAIMAEGELATKQLKEVQGDIQNCQGMIQRARAAEKNSLIPYGNNIKAVLEEINRARWRGEKPLGPLGMFVKAKDPKTWGDLLRSQISGHLTAFAITTAEDMNQLKAILTKYKNYRTNIIVSQRDLFDYSGGELPEGYLTVLRALEISDPFVLRILINQVGIERQVLAYKRDEAQAALQRLPHGGAAWTLDKFTVRVYGEGGVSVNPLNLRPRNDATSLLLTGRDSASEIRHHETQIKTFEAKYQAALANEQRLRAEYANGRQQLTSLQKQHAAANDRFRRAKTALTNLQQEVNDDMPSNITSLQAAKEDVEAEKENVMAQFKDVARQKQAFDDKNKTLLPELERIKGRISEFNQHTSSIVAKIEDAVEKRLKAQKGKDYFVAKMTDEMNGIKKVQAVADVLQEEFTNWTTKALEYCERVEHPRKADVVKRNLDSVQQSLKERERRQEMTIEVNKAKAKLDTAANDLKQMTHLNKTLKSSLIVRLQRWQEFRRHIALRCKYVFAYHLSHRGYFGKVLFNHDNGTLFLKVQTDDQIQQTQGSREKDPRSLSGGEKSFSTICLLLSLWESIGCPLRCLDEFDVFMDAVNRRISMKMMIDTANSSDKKQYILITPQDMGNVQLGPTVKVNRMTDPERTQAN
ncbi:hypothetical protein DXG03_008186 [Asterophora parasitica]|uniref:RecF/RecN/SMC N-terminal domain-containing protein n=1 Tax=Asterophora parasitica TaxID=117018 RepID=A0A9P7GCJ1_9AGAR|nr:hypothetical protein DXG03_008186 [Asterophora parasitica]